MSTFQLNNKEYDVIVIGGGHAGVEASLAPARLGFKTLLILGNIKKLANMPCNPSIGGPAKGILVREIDALGGEMGKAADLTALQFKMLNLSKGPAVRALRVQSDKVAYNEYMYNVVKHQANLDYYEGFVDEIVVDAGKVCGVILEDGTTFKTKKIIVATGTYLSSRTLRGSVTKVSGPDNEKTNYGLSKSLLKLGLELKRLKTGTPPRIQTASIDFTKAAIEPGTPHALVPCLSFSHDPSVQAQIDYSHEIPCYLIYTTPLTHQIILEHLKESSMYSGIVEGIGPRYCPSIEDKIVRFKDKPRHQLFLEPEDKSFLETYLQGFSTSMPEHVQDLMIRSLPGFEHAVVNKYAYAIEYDAINPLELTRSLETKKIEGLYFAGQVNGTSGYEEAACQGLMAGINASLALQNKEPLILHRDEAYIGVLIDDLITKGIRDPYRMLTSRAEYRLLLRHDNADSRLSEYGHAIGLLSEERYNLFIAKQAKIQNEKTWLEATKIVPSSLVNDYLTSKNSAILKDGITCAELMKRPEIDYHDITEMLNVNHLNDLALEELITTEIKYQGYITKAYKEAKKALKLETWRIPADLDYHLIPNLASEAREKLLTIKPTTIAQATRISGVNPSDINILLVYLESRKTNDDNE